MSDLFNEHINFFDYLNFDDLIIEYCKMIQKYINIKTMIIKSSIYDNDIKTTLKDNTIVNIGKLHKMNNLFPQFCFNIIRNKISDDFSCDRNNISIIWGKIPRTWMKHLVENILYNYSIANEYYMNKKNSYNDFNNVENNERKKYCKNMKN